MLCESRYISRPFEDYGEDRQDKELKDIITMKAVK